MRDFSIDLIWAKVQAAITAIGGWLGYFLGGFDGLLYTLIVFMVVDYVTGVMCAVYDKKLHFLLLHCCFYYRVYAVVNARIVGNLNVAEFTIHG